MYQKFIITSELTADNPTNPNTNLNVRTKEDRMYTVTMEQEDSLTRTKGSKVAVK